MQGPSVAAGLMRSDAPAVCWVFEQASILIENLDTDPMIRLLWALTALHAGRTEAVATLREFGDDASHLGIVALQAWLAGSADLAREIWQRRPAESEWGEGSTCFPLAVADVLISKNAESMERLARIEGDHPDYFRSSSPAHTRCFSLALAYAALGLGSQAEQWHSRALEQDPSALLRVGAWQRACQQGGLEP